MLRRISILVFLVSFCTTSAHAGDVRTITTGTVQTVVGTPSAPFAAAAAGDAVEVILEFIDNPDMVTPMFWSYPSDVLIGGITINGASAITSTFGGVAEMTNGTSDAVTFGATIVSGNVGGVAITLVNPDGTMLGSPDLTALIGTSISPTGLSIFGTGLLTDGSGAWNIVFDITQVRFEAGTCSRVGANYCAANLNSTARPASMAACGSTSAAANNLEVHAVDLPQGSFGFFLTSQSQGLVMNPGGSAGDLCLGGAIGRYVGPGQIQNSGVDGRIALVLDLTQLPTPTGPVSVAAGETWHFTAWFRDSVGGVPTSNFADGLEIAFQ